MTVAKIRQTLRALGVPCTTKERKAVLERKLQEVHAAVNDALTPLPPTPCGPAPTLPIRFAALDGIRLRPLKFRRIR
jgi:hypothetical protein